MRESRLNNIGLNKLALCENVMPSVLHFLKSEFHQPLAMCKVGATSQTSQLVNSILLYTLRFSSLEFLCFSPCLSNKFLILYIYLCPHNRHLVHIVPQIFSIGHSFSFSSFLYTHLVLEMLNLNYIIY